MPSTEDYEELIARMTEFPSSREEQFPESATRRWKAAAVAWLTQFRFAPQSDGAPLLIWSAGVTLASAAIGTFSGWLMGALMGGFNPGYYVAIFGAERTPGFDPYEVAVGLGITQGAGAGLGVGLALVAMHYAYRYFARRPTMRQLDAG
jgi:hypothetical protein